jgi:hypothetical protein
LTLAGIIRIIILKHQGFFGPASGDLPDVGSEATGCMEESSSKQGIMLLMYPRDDTDPDMMPDVRFQINDLGSF